MTVLVRVDDLVFDYGDVRALDHVEFAIERGSVTALVGPNGAGKTTLLRCLAGLEQPLAGHLTIDDIDVTDRPREVHRRIGFLQDFFGVYDALSVRRNLLHAAAGRGIASGEIERAADRAAAAVGLADRAPQRAGELSRGLRQRLAIARAIVHRPLLLLLDEPASGLDPEARKSLSDQIRLLQADGMTIIVSSHILAELEDYSTQMLTLRAGRAAGPVSLHAGSEERRRVRVGVMGDATAARRVAEEALGLAVTGVQGQEFVLELAAGEAAQHEALRGLMENGVAVTAFFPLTTTLEQLYLEGMPR